MTGWASILRTLLVHQEHWQSLSMLNFLQLATPVAEEWEGQEAEEEAEDEGYELDGEDEVEEEQELQEREFTDALGESARLEFAV